MRRVLMFDPWQQLHQVAGFVAAVELFEDDLVHPEPAGAGRPRQAEENGAAADAGEGARFDG